MIEAIPYEFQHVLDIELNEAFEDKAQLIQAYKDVTGFSMESIRHVESGEILAIFSGGMLTAKTFEISALVGKNAAKYPVQFYKHTARRIDHYERKMGVHRIQATIRAGHPFLIKWIGMLGFQREALMRKFGPDGDDYFLYARVK